MQGCRVMKEEIYLLVFSDCEADETLAFLFPRKCSCGWRKLSKNMDVMSLVIQV